MPEYPTSRTTPTGTVLTAVPDTPAELPANVIDASARFQARRTLALARTVATSELFDGSLALDLTDAEGGHQR